MPEFEFLCSDLRLTEKLEEPIQLTRLKAWWEAEVSTDVTFQGTEAGQYNQYLAAAKEYCNIILAPGVAPEVAIQHAAKHGYDCWLSKIIKEQDKIINQQDNDEMTLLHWAAAKGHVKTVQVLLDKGANSKSPNRNTELPIFTSLLMPINSNDTLYSRKKTIFNMLLTDFPESISHQNKEGETVFHLIAMDGHFNDLLTELLEKKITALDTPNNNEEYPIHSAILNNQIENVHTLLESETGMEELLGKNKRVALHYAAQYGSKDMLNVCIANLNRVNIDVRDTYDKTALMLAAEASNKSLIDILLHKGADKTLKDYDGKTYQELMKNASLNNNRF